jgi:hypothetical protein
MLKIQPCELISSRFSRTLTGISIFCLANKKSAWFTRIFGGAAGNEGIGMFALCLDWNYVGSGGGSLGALFTPLSTQLSLYFGVMICMSVLLVFSTLGRYILRQYLQQQYRVLRDLRGQHMELAKLPIPFASIVQRRWDTLRPTLHIGRELPP